MILRPIQSVEAVAGGGRSINLRCPACRRDVTFSSVGSDVALTIPNVGRIVVGSRRCGNPECRGHLFVVYHGSHGLLTSYPPETLDFDSSDLPERVVNAFEEAIKCHAQQCFVASAIMVRKTLEEVCADREATGGNLKEKIAALGEKVLMPQALLEGLDDLRLLGNDAAHLESRVYEQVGQEEVEVAIDVTKEILKATYQYEGIMGRLRALKKND